MSIGNRNGGTNRESRSRYDFGGHQHPVGARVEKGPSVALPGGCSPACRRNRPRTADFWKCADVDFVSSRLVGNEGNPAAVRRNLASPVSIRSMQQRIRFLL